MLPEGCVCGRCYDNPREECAGCGTIRFVYTRDDHGEPLCEVCVRRGRQRRRDARVTAEIVTTLRRGPAAGIPAGRLATIVTGVAPRPCDRRALAGDLATLATLTSDGSDPAGDPSTKHSDSRGVGQGVVLGLAARRLVLALGCSGCWGCRCCGAGSAVRGLGRTGTPRWTVTSAEPARGTAPVAVVPAAVPAAGTAPAAAVITGAAPRAGNA